MAELLGEILNRITVFLRMKYRIFAKGRGFSRRLCSAAVALLDVYFESGPA